MTHVRICVPIFKEILCVCHGFVCLKTMLGKSVQSIPKIALCLGHLSDLNLLGYYKTPNVRHFIMVLDINYNPFTTRAT